MSDGRYIRTIPDSFIERAERKLEEVQSQYKMEIKIDVGPQSEYVDVNSPYHHLRNGFRHGAPLLAWLDGLMAGYKEHDRQMEVSLRRQKLEEQVKISYVITCTQRLFHVWYRQGQRPLQRAEHPSNPAMTLDSALKVLLTVANAGEDGVTVTIIPAAQSATL
jgi:hypothetical protein